MTILLFNVLPLPRSSVGTSPLPPQPLEDTAHPKYSNKGRRCKGQRMCESEQTEWIEGHRHRCSSPSEQGKLQFPGLGNELYPCSFLMPTCPLLFMLTVLPTHLPPNLPKHVLESSYLTGEQGPSDDSVRSYPREGQFALMNMEEVGRKHCFLWANSRTFRDGVETFLFLPPWRKMNRND